MTMNDERLVAIPFFGEGDQLLDMFLGRQDMAVERLGNVADPDVEMALWIDLGRARDERLDIEKRDETACAGRAHRLGDASERTYMKSRHIFILA